MTIQEIIAELDKLRKILLDLEEKILYNRSEEK